ncbi:hypothetical protein NQ318_013115 [Aromia moschata]|uniref:Uncharacterized protein n=1 Tax=Aromia moschata TaxID=1265417 RepID=A0AAV8XDC7_9CUCU|nr:hypothetical protein NQ318_013115 [Aromia moschata]
MMGSSLLLFHLLVILGSALADAEVPSTTAVPTSPQPVYKPPEQPPGYISQPMYGYPEAYGGSLYDALFYPPSVPYKPPAYVDQPPPSNYVSSLMPAAQGAVQFVLKVLAKFGLFLIGGVALLVVGGILPQRFQQLPLWFKTLLENINGYNGL